MKRKKAKHRFAGLHDSRSAGTIERETKDIERMEQSLERTRRQRGPIAEAANAAPHLKRNCRRQQQLEHATRRRGLVEPI